MLSLLALLVQKSTSTDGEDTQGAHAEYRHLKVALAETEASVKYMMLHCSNEASFAFCPDSGTEAGQYILVFVSILVPGLKCVSIKPRFKVEELERHEHFSNCKYFSTRPQVY